MDKQIFAALEINDGEIRLIVGEFFNIRFNIIKVERVLCEDWSNDIEADADKIIKGIKRAVMNASKQIGAPIEKVLLCVPTVHFSRFPLRVKVEVDNQEQRVKIEDIARGYRKAIKTPLNQDRALVNAMITKYYCNGITTRKMPLNEKCSELYMDVDLLCADKEETFKYVTLAEKSGLKVMDIFLDTYAVCKEAALLEQTLSQKTLLIKLERYSTSFVVLANGRMANAKVLDTGLAQWFKQAQLNYHLDVSVISRLVKYNVKLQSMQHTQSPIYIWSNSGQTKTVSEKDIFNCLSEPMTKWIELISEVAKDIAESGPMNIVICGEGSELQGLDIILADKLQLSVRNYIPETLGIRNGSLSAPVGAFYAFKDVIDLKPNLGCSVDLVEYTKTVYASSKRDEQEEKTITSKLKNMFEKKKEEIER